MTDAEEQEAPAAAPEVEAPPEPEAVPPAKPPASEEQSLADVALQRLKLLLPGVKDTEVLKDLAELADADALEALVRRGRPPKWQKKPSIAGYAALVGDNKAEASKSEALSKAKNFGTVGGSSLAVGGAGQGGGLGLNRPGFGPKVQHFGGPVGGSGSLNAELQVAEEINKKWQEIQEDNQGKDTPDWVLCTYSANSKQLELKTSGKGLSGLKAELGDELAWAGFRCVGVDKRGGLECRRNKYINVQYKPEVASSIKKARMGSHKSAVKQALIGTHLDIAVETMADLDEQNLMQKLQAATGAHKPNGYEFDEGVFMEADFYGLGIGANCKGETSRN